MLFALKVAFALIAVVWFFAAQVAWVSSPDVETFSTWFAALVWTGVSFGPPLVLAWVAILIGKAFRRDAPQPEIRRRRPAGA